ncbi:DUF6243 family protein [Streptomyces sp. CAU 1734]|uniref:DUF6243 family protein n=1 Tax=Streptomyces sp. CAU 1734 TaxID=3140360 RepID=UPI0032605639
MAKSRNNLLGVGGQRKKLSRAEQQGHGPSGQQNRQTAAEQKSELLRKMRERAQDKPGEQDAQSQDDGSAASGA